MTPRLLATCLLAAPLLAGCPHGGGGAASAPSELKTDEEKTLYALGLIVARNLKTFDLNATELEIVKRGLTDSATGKKPAAELETFGPKVNELAQARQRRRSEGEKQKGKEFLDKAAAEAGASKTDSGLVFKSIKAGQGASPKATDRVKVHYHGTLIDGTVFDSSVKRGVPAEFSLNGVIPCWTEGVQKMKVGEKARLVCPSAIAYGESGSPPVIPGGATLIFEVELLEIVAAPPPAQLIPPSAPIPSK